MSPVMAPVTVGEPSMLTGRLLAQRAATVHKTEGVTRAQVASASAASWLSKLGSNEAGRAELRSHFGINQP